MQKAITMMAFELTTPVTPCLLFYLTNVFGMDDGNGMMMIQ